VKFEGLDNIPYMAKEGGPLSRAEQSLRAFPSKRGEIKWNRPHPKTINECGI